MLDSYEIINLNPVLSENLHFNKLSGEEYILSNSNDKHYLKINKETYHFLLLIDGKRTLGEIVDLFNQNNSNVLTLNYAYNLLYIKLSEFGILKGFEAKIKPYKKPPYLNLSFIIINDRILTSLVKNFHFLFKKKIACIIIFVCISFITINLFHNFDIYKSFNLQESIYYFFFVMATSVTFHEIGHASSASYFRAKHGGIGGGFYLFTPVYFADVTDIWKLSKMKRIIVNLSGMYFELIFCSILSFFALILNNNTLLIITLIVCVKTLFNLNPFFRSDGYWILSDLTSKPNLFYHATNKIKELATFFTKGQKPKWTSVDFLLFTYALISYSFISIFIYYVLVVNSNSIIYFPKNLFYFLKNLFSSNSEFNLIKYSELVIPLLFFTLVINFLKPIILKQLKKFKKRS